MFFWRKRHDEDKDKSGDASSQVNNDVRTETEVNNEVFGKLKYEYVWIGNMEIEFFGKKNTLDVIIDTEEHEPVETEQEEAFREYLSRKEELDARIISELRKGYGLDESFDLCERFELNKLLIHSGGDFGFSFIDHNAPEGRSDRDVVVTVLPEVSYFSSEEDYF
jgi:hypothetical protein